MVLDLTAATSQVFSMAPPKECSYSHNATLGYVEVGILIFFGSDWGGGRKLHVIMTLWVPYLHKHSFSNFDSSVEAKI